MPPSYALLGGFAIGARVELLWKHNANAKCQRVHTCTRSLPSYLLPSSFVSANKKFDIFLQTQMASVSRPHRSANAALRVGSFNVQVFGRKKVADERVFDILVKVRYMTPCVSVRYTGRRSSLSMRTRAQPGVFIRRLSKRSRGQDPLSHEQSDP